MIATEPQFKKITFALPTNIIQKMQEFQVSTKYKEVNKSTQHKYFGV